MVTETIPKIFGHLELPALPYAYDALEPVISKEIMELHHKKHHQGYVTNFNAASEKSLEAVSRGDIPDVIARQPALRFNGGGHINHAIFWTNLAPKDEGGGRESKGPLAQALNQLFGSIEKFKEKFNAMAGAIQGSGWGWLGYDKAMNRLVLTTCANQDPLSTQGYIPLLGIDVWEHAYYLQYKNVRPDYLKKIWEVVNWQNIEERYAAALK